MLDMQYQLTKEHTQKLIRQAERERLAQKSSSSKTDIKREAKKG